MVHLLGFTIRITSTYLLVDYNLLLSYSVLSIIFDVKLLVSITLVHTQNVSVTKIVDSSSIQRAETKYGLRIQGLALVFTIHEVWLSA
jgi:hypothetical protein